MGIGAVLPILPRYVHGPIGAGDFAVGLVTGAFAFTAVVGRPLAGRAADARGRRTLLIAGALATAVAGALYYVPAGVPGLIVARLVLGVGDGAVFTAGATWTVDMAPERSRGRAIGLFGLAIWGSLSLGPVIGEGLYELGGYDAVWAFATVSPLLGALVARSLTDPYEPQPPVAGRPSFLPRDALRPGAALALANIGYATLAGFIVLHLSALGLGGGAGVFTAFATAVVASRLFAGRLPDVVGPRRSAVAAAAAEAAGLAIIAVATSLAAAIAGAIVMGIGFSLLFPSLALVVVNSVGDEQRGSGMGAFTAFFDVGFGIGGPLAGAIATVSDYPTAFWVASAAAAAASVLIAATALRERATAPA
jgi:MFS family permease